jgi:hypothetical protein
MILEYLDNKDQIKNDNNRASDFRIIFGISFCIVCKFFVCFFFFFTYFALCQSLGLIMYFIFLFLSNILIQHGIMGSQLQLFPKPRTHYRIEVKDEKRSTLQYFLLIN